MAIGELITEQLVTVNMIIIVLFMVVGLIHIIILFNLVHRSRKELTSGHLKDFTGSVLLTIIIGFLFFLWGMFTKLGFLYIKNQVLDLIITSVIAISFLMIITHLAYSAKDFSKNFGFSKVGEKLTNLAKNKK